MEDIDEKQSDIKPCVPTSQQATTSMHSLKDQNIVPSSSYVCNDQKPFTGPGNCHGCNDENPFSGPMPSSYHGCNDQNNFIGLDTNMSGSNEILLRLDQCDVNENEIPGLFKYMEKYLPGYRFVPTDDQLVTHYLRKKISNEYIPRCLIRDVNLYQHHPKELAERYPRHDSLIDEWYFFTPRDRKYPNGSRPKRAAGNGYWKATGADRPVKVKEETVGFRQALVFYEGKPPKGEKTSWIMHEFKVVEKRQRNSKGDMRLDDWVLCRIYYKKVDKPLKKEEEVPSSNNVEDNHVEEYILGYDDDDILLSDSGCIFPPESILLPPDYLTFWSNDNFDCPNFTNFDQDFPNDKLV